MRRDLELVDDRVGRCAGMRSFWRGLAGVPARWGQTVAVEARGLARSFLHRGCLAVILYY
jgi:hypothetical protein